MSNFEKKFFSLLKEEEDVDALAATPEDDANALADTLDDPDSLDDLDDTTTQDPEHIPEPHPNYDRDLDQLDQWINTIKEFKDYLNGGAGSILARLKDEAKIGTIFDGLSDSTKSDILNIAEKLASLNEQLRNLHIEKNK